MEYFFDFFRQPKPKKSNFESQVMAKLDKLTKQGERHMVELDELKMATDTFTADILTLNDVVRVAMDRIGELASRNDMAAVKAVVQEANASLKGAHESLTATTAALKAKVDEVSASGGDAS